MNRLVIVGAGQYGFAAKEIAEEMCAYDNIDFLDDFSDIAIGKFDDIEKIEYDAAVVAIGNPIIRAQMFHRISKTAVLIHPMAIVSASAKIGEGTIIEAGAVVCSNATIGKGSIVMANAVVGHDAIVGEFCQLKYNCTIPERCNVPNQTKIDCNVVYKADK